MISGSANKKKTTIFGHLTVTTFWGLRWVQKYNITENMVYSPGVPKNTFFEDMLLSMHIEPTYSKINFWGPAHTPMSNFRKSRKNGAISRKNKDIFFFFFGVTSAKKMSPKFLKFQNISFCS